MTLISNSTLSWTKPNGYYDYQILTCDSLNDINSKYFINNTKISFNLTFNYQNNTQNFTLNSTNLISGLKYECKLLTFKELFEFKTSSIVSVRLSKIS